MDAHVALANQDHAQGRALPQDFRQRVATGKPLVGGTRSAKVKPRKAKHLNRNAD
jgi:hypothetical protein